MWDWLKYVLFNRGQRSVFFKTDCLSMIPGRKEGYQFGYLFSIKDKVDSPVSLYVAMKKSNGLMAHSYSAHALR